MKEEKMCLENINGECRNLSKKLGATTITDKMGLECPHCLRRSGKDGNGNQLVPPEKAEKVFEILKDKIEK